MTFHHDVVVISSDFYGGYIFSGLVFVLFSFWVGLVCVSFCFLFSSCLVAPVTFWLFWPLWLRFRSIFVYPSASLKRPRVRLESK